MNIGSLFIALGFDVDDQKLKGFQDEITAVRNNLFKVTAVAAGAVFAINRFVASSVSDSVKLKNFTQQTGIAGDEVERFYNVAGRLNTELTLDSTIGMFQNLADTISLASEGMGAIGEATRLGLPNIGSMTPIEAINKLRERLDENIANLGYKRTIDLMSAIGVTPEFIETIKATDAEFARLANNPILGESMRQKILGIAKAQKELSFQWNLFKGQVTEDIAIPIIDTLNSAFPIFKQFVGGLKAIGSDLSFASEKFETFFSVLKYGALGVLAVLNPVLAVLGALGYGVYDLGKYAQGKESYTGKGMLAFLDLMKSQEGSVALDLKRTLAQQNPSSSLSSKYFDATGSRDIASYANSKNVNNNTTMNIQSSASPRDVAQEVINLMNGQYKLTQDDLNTGALPDLR